MERRNNCRDLRTRQSSSWFYNAASKLPFSLISLLITAVRADLPYNPTYVLRSFNNNGTYVYILEPPSSAATQGQLLALNTSSVLNSTSLPTIKLSNSLPFLLSDPSIAYTPVLDPDGSLIIYAGNCSAGASRASIWRYTPGSTGIGGAWTNQSFNATDNLSSDTQSGPQYLGGGIAFSNNSTNGMSQVYTFGGMCPFTNSTESTWIDSATYSDDLLLYQSSQLSSLSLDQVTPVAEAGFTFTPLSPQYSNGSQDVIQQQDFLLLGGNMGNAFINISEVALLSLPQDIWTFESINAPADANDTIVEPRSGHTATLVSDGRQIVVIGGWVGDTSTPATPQLAVLDIGVGYGGVGDWAWSVPNSSTSPFESGGVYGHGAVLLDSDVVMVVGGYSISGASTRMRRADQIVNSQNLFYNISSGQWITSYGTASVTPTTTASSETAGIQLSKSQQIGLGVGLGVGLLVLILALVCCWLCIRRRKRTKEHHQIKADPRLTSISTEYKGSNAIEDENTSPDTAKHLHEETEKDEVQSEQPWNSRPRSGGQWTWIPHNSRLDREPSWRNNGVREADRTGLDIDVPSPRRGLRKNKHSTVGRGSYQTTPVLYDEPPSGFNTMYAIEERSEGGASNAGSRKPSISKTGSSPQQQRASDPFRDPQRPISGLFQESHSGSQELPRKPVRSHAVRPTIDAPPTVPSHVVTRTSSERQRNVSPWIRDWAATDTLLPHSPPDQFPPQYDPGALSSESLPLQASEYEGQSPLVALPGERRNLSRQSVQYFFPGLLNRFTGVSFSLRSSSSKSQSRPGTARSHSQGSRPNTSGTLGTFASLPRAGESTVYAVPLGTAADEVVSSTDQQQVQDQHQSSSGDGESFITAHSNISDAAAQAHHPESNMNPNRNTSSASGTRTPETTYTTHLQPTLGLPTPATSSSRTFANPPQTPRHYKTPRLDFYPSLAADMDPDATPTARRPLLEPSPVRSPYHSTPHLRNPQTEPGADYPTSPTPRQPPSLLPSPSPLGARIRVNGPRSFSAGTSTANFTSTTHFQANDQGSPTRPGHLELERPTTPENETASLIPPPLFTPTQSMFPSQPMLPSVARTSSGYTSASWHTNDDGAVLSSPSRPRERVVRSPQRDGREGKGKGRAVSDGHTIRVVRYGTTIDSPTLGQPATLRHPQVAPMPEWEAVTPRKQGDTQHTSPHPEPLKSNPTFLGSFKPLPAPPKVSNPGQVVSEPPFSVSEDTPTAAARAPVGRPLPLPIPQLHPLPTTLQMVMPHISTQALHPQHPPRPPSQQLQHQLLHHKSSTHLRVHGHSHSRHPSISSDFTVSSGGGEVVGVPVKVLTVPRGGLRVVSGNVGEGSRLMSGEQGGDERGGVGHDSGSDGVRVVGGSVSAESGGASGRGRGTGNGDGGGSAGRGGAGGGGGGNGDDRGRVVSGGSDGEGAWIGGRGW